MRINKHDTQGTKPLLGKGELGYDDYTAGGDTGRVYVGTSTENIAMAKRLEANMMTKAQFNALAEERKANRAGSGFDSFGWGSTSIPSTDYIVNEGMWVRSTVPNTIHSSRSDASSQGISKSKIPIVNINGVQHKIFDNGGDRINLPTAPTIYPYDTVLTPEQIASGVIKHADASNSGLIVNGKFDTDTSGWTAYYNGTISEVNGKIRLTDTLADGGSARAVQGIQTVIGKKYIAETVSSNINNATTHSLAVFTGSSGDGSNVSILTQANAQTFRLEFVATTSISYITIMVNASVANGYAEFDNIAVYPADAISRSDLVFLESWHEDISEKNFVYPLGNVQYFGVNSDGLTGIANGAFAGSATYSLFSDTWQTASALIGKGYVWSSLTEVQKKAFISNPENNCYLDGDKVIQVRYRIRVVQGSGDSWEFPQVTSLSPLQYNASLLVKPKGKNVSISTDVGTSASGGIFAGFSHAFVDGVSQINGDVGIAQGVSGVDSLFSGAYEGKCYALPIALVHR